MDLFLKSKPFHTRHQSFPSILSKTSRTLSISTSESSQLTNLILSPETILSIQKELKKINENSKLSSENDILSVIKSLISQVENSKNFLKKHSSGYPEDFSLYLQQTSEKNPLKSSSSSSSLRLGTETFDEKINSLSSHEIFLKETLRKLERKEKSLDFMKNELLIESKKLDENKKFFKEMKKNLLERLQVIEIKVRRITKEFLKFVKVKAPINHGEIIENFQYTRKNSDLLRTHSKDLDNIVKKGNDTSENLDDFLEKSRKFQDFVKSFQDSEKMTGKNLDKLEMKINNLDFLLDQVTVISKNEESSSGFHRKSVSQSENLESDLNTTVISQVDSGKIRNNALLKAGIARQLRMQELDGFENDLIEEKKKIKQDSETLFKIFQEFEVMRKRLEQEKIEIDKEKIILENERPVEEEKTKSEQNAKILFEVARTLIKKKSLHFKNNKFVIRVFDNVENELHKESVDFDSQALN